MNPQYYGTGQAGHNESGYGGGAGYNDYSYPPNVPAHTAYGYGGAVSSSNEKANTYDHSGEHQHLQPGGAGAEDMQRLSSYTSDAATSVTHVGSISPYDEKASMADKQQPQYPARYDGGAGGLGGNNNDDDAIPPAVPRPQRPNSNFQAGHISRGSVALMAAAEGKIPKKEGLKMWRSDEHHGVFTAGGRRRTCARCCCCTMVLALIIIVGVVAAFLLWVRPPNVEFKGVLAPQDGSQELSVSSNGFNLNFDLDIAVSNPNFFGASFKKLQAKAYYPTNTASAIGGGQMLNVRIPAHSHNTLYFPFAINYTKTIDPNNAILEDIAQKCGFIGDSPSNIKVNYDLTLTLKIVLFTISPTFSSSTSFACPLSLQDVQGLVGSSDLSGLLGGSASG